MRTFRRFFHDIRMLAGRRRTDDEVVVLRPARHRARHGSPTADGALLAIRRVSTLRGVHLGLDTRTRPVAGSGRRQACSTLGVL
jgi:hypothetical protein